MITLKSMTYIFIFQKAQYLRMAHLQVSPWLRLCLSAVTGHKVKAEVAMTGEITLRGRVLPIGGLKEKNPGNANGTYEEGSGSG